MLNRGHDTPSCCARKREDGKVAVEIAMANRPSAARLSVSFRRGVSRRCQRHLPWQCHGRGAEEGEEKCQWGEEFHTHPYGVGYDPRARGADRSGAPSSDGAPRNDGVWVGGHCPSRSTDGGTVGRSLCDAAENVAPRLAMLSSSDGTTKSLLADPSAIFGKF